ncbi:MAG: GTP-binding protein [Thermoplasmata archaeon]|nr:MAG: GTP-binding protein [Thermoplasmata archaeon]
MSKRSGGISQKSTSKYIKRKVLLLGDEAVGKTSLIRKFVMDKFDDKYIATIGTKVTKKELEIKNNGDIIYLTMMIWDVLGQKDYRSVQTASFKGADGVIFVCDFTRRDTVGSLEDYWLKSLGNNISQLQLIFVANKSDLTEDAQFSLDDLEKVASKYDSTCFSSSAKTGENVEDLFLTLGNRLIEEREDLGEGRMDVEDLEEELTLVLATDRIIDDFCSNFGNMELAMPIIRRQFSEAGVDIRNPTKKGLLKVIDLLAKVEQGYKKSTIVKENRMKRRFMVQKVKG